MEDDAKYFARRAADERAAAQRTKLPAARRAHLELAERYEDLGRAIGLTQTSPMLRVVQPGSPVATAE